MLQLCAAWKTQQILNLAEKGELPGHSTASNIIANYSFANIPSQGLIVYAGKGPQISYLEIHFHTITQEIKSYVINTFKDHHDKLRNAGWIWLAGFLIFMVFAFAMLAVEPIFGAICILLLVPSPFFLMCYQRKLYDEYTQVLLPGLTSYIQNTLLTKYRNGNNINAYLLFPATWNTTISDCNCGCGPNLQWMTVRFTLGIIQQPHGAPVYWSSTQNGTQLTVNMQPQQITQVQQTYTQETTPMMYNNRMQPQQQNITQQYPQQQVTQQNIEPVAPTQVLPPGWRMAKTNEGRVYYINDMNKSTQWQHPGFNV